MLYRERRYVYIGCQVAAISSYLINKAGFKVTEAHTGAVTLIQRFGSALNLNLHFHALFNEAQVITPLHIA